jgi:hypothetical protein
VRLRTALVSISGIAAILGTHTLGLAQDAAGTIDTIAGNGTLGFLGITALLAAPNSPLRTVWQQTRTATCLLSMRAT